MTEHQDDVRTTGSGGLLGQRYRLVARIAGGGMGEVWRAVDEVLDRVVAVKILRREYADDATFRERFRAEARHTAGLAHPSVAAVYDFGDGDDGSESPYLVMEHVDGEPLSAVLAREGALPIARTLELLGHAAAGMQAAHDAGVIHRDIKPANLLVTGSQVKITDFGIARAANSVPLTQTGAIMGTAYYISPEQASGSSVTPASDLYSLGVVAYECLSGRRPFAGDTPVSVALAQVREPPPPLPESIPADVRELVMSMLAKDPSDRPSSAGEVAGRALALAPAYRASEPEAVAEGVDPTRALPFAAEPSGEPAGRYDTDPGFVLPPESAGRWVPYAVGIAALLVLLFVAAGAFDRGEDPAPKGGAPKESAAAQAVQVAAADYVGRPVEAVRAELSGLGLRVARQEAASGGPVGTVKAVEPTGAVPVGNTVTVVWVAGSGDGDGQPHDEDGSADKNGRGKDGKGKGNGKGNGKGD